MKIAVVGAGAMGALFAARMAAGGLAVTLVDVDPVRIAQIAADGLRASVAGQALCSDTLCVAPATLGSGQDLIVLFTKFAALRPALTQACHALAPDGIVAVLANGLDAAGQLDGLVPAERLVIGVTDVAADLRNGIAHSDGSGVVKLGMGDPASSARPCGRVAAWLERAGFAVSQQADIRTAVWEKVAFNAGFNALATLADACVRDLDNEPGRRIVGSVLDEVAAVAKAAGVPFDLGSVRARVDAAFALQGGHRPSMAQDRRAGRRTEIEAINGAVAACAQRLGMAAPVNRTLTDLVLLTGG
ncbi:ketopantoate reductase family protein [Novosphingobium kaempferiae]|uniref:ketopantoate reductase family protein n=1 Tax=Novosphingobium kaempferiae TaxID=2896849 RepID=UPI001E2BB821|nr:2-dehydropantoate 2-reductase [Novosphingobium kaempferiae]